jgi:hypothetical protein
MIFKWHKQLSSDDQRLILDIAHSVPIGRLFGKVDQDDAAILPGWALEGGQAIHSTPSVTSSA